MGKMDLSGHKYGRLLVLGRSQKREKYWCCRCECGAKIEAHHSNLRSGHTKSCGCLKIEKVRMIRLTHGYTAGGRTPEFDVWSGIRKRCNTKTAKDYPNYGGRGIKVCKRWDFFPNFLQDMGPRPTPNHSIDRIDTNGDYEPKNCRWATRKEQNRNRRNTRFVVYKGKRQPLGDVADLLKQGKRGHKRLYELHITKGVPLEEAFEHAKALG